MSTMESFLGGKTLAAVKKFADTSDVKELAIRFLLYGTVAEIFARENGFHHGMGGTRSSCRSASTPTTPSSAAPPRSQRALRCIRRTTIRRASSSATSAMRPSAAALSTRP